MSRLDYLLSKKALTDLEEIWNYTNEHWSADQADRYYELIIDEINYICGHPDSGKSMEHVRKGYRSSKVKSHLIFYKLVDEVVHVVRILHERMDVPNRI